MTGILQTYVGDELALDYALISSYNTAANDGQYMWVDDNQNIWWFKVKTPVEVESNTGTDLASSVDGYDITVNITDGEVLKDAATTTGGNTTDSIHMNVEFLDNHGTIYTIAGYRRTGLIEDQH